MTAHNLWCHTAYRIKIQMNKQCFVPALSAPRLSLAVMPSAWMNTCFNASLSFQPSRTEEHINTSTSCGNTELDRRHDPAQHLVCSDVFSVQSWSYIKRRNKKKKQPSSSHVSYFSKLSLNKQYHLKQFG